VEVERYNLYFGTLKVGTVTQTNSDFPNLWGTVVYEPWVSGPQSPDAAVWAFGAWCLRFV
jgi:hypothetical protein